MADCPNFKQPENQPTTQPETDVCLPWTGRALGINDLALASARAGCAMIGIIGTAGSGKTSLLTALFAHLSRTGKIGEHQFSGSLTIRGWSQLRHYTRWPSQPGPAFPPHTPDKGGRIPSILHLAFRSGGGIARDILFTDAPGEWFSRWIENRTAPNAQGARWIAENCTHFCLTTDVNSFAGDGVGMARTTTRTLARILSEVAAGRPVATAWTKADLPRNKEVETQIREGVTRFLPDATTLDISVTSPRCLDLASWILASQHENTSHPATPSTAFMAYGYRETR